MKDLPKYYAIQHNTRDPRWEIYVKWINEKSGHCFTYGIPFPIGSYLGYGYDKYDKYFPSMQFVLSLVSL